MRKTSAVPANAASAWTPRLPRSIDAAPLALAVVEFEFDWSIEGVVEAGLALPEPDAEVGDPTAEVIMPETEAVVEGTTLTVELFELEAVDTTTVAPPPK